MSKKIFSRNLIASLPLFLLATPVHKSFAGEAPFIVITPSSIEQPREQAGMAVTVIDAETIEKSQAHNLAELLRGAAGLHVSDLFGDGSQARLDLRGFGPTAQSNTLVLVDGRKLNNASDTATPDLSTIELADIKQIEILQGSAGVLYGNQAVGGVINIITYKNSSDRASVKLDIGSYNASKVTAVMKKRIGQTGLSLTVSDAQSDNYRDHNETDKQHVAVKLERQHKGFTGYVELSSTDDHIQTAGALLKSEMDVSRTQSLSFYENDYFDTRTNVLAIGLEKPVSDTQVFNIDFSKRITDREFIQAFRPFTPSLSTQDRDTKALTSRYRISSARMTTILGLNLEQTDYTLVTSFGPQSIDQSISDVYVYHQFDLTRASQIQGGYRYSSQDADISPDNFDDSLGVFSVGYRWLHEQWKLTARADQNYRYPTVEEHTNVPFGQPAGLKTQQGISYELGAEYTTAGVRYRTTLYTIRLDDEIGFDASGFSNLNLDATRRKGIILEANRDWSSALTSTVSLTLLDAEISSGPFKGNDLPQVPQKSIRIDTSFQYSDQWSLGGELIAVGEQSFGGDFANQLNKMSGYEVVNGHIAFKNQNWNFSLRVNNLFDASYSESGSVFTEFAPVFSQFEAFFPAPERHYWISAKYLFK